MVAVLQLADNDSPPTDQRRITEHDPALKRLKARTVRQLTQSVHQLVSDLRHGVQPHEAQSRFIQRHITLMRSAYEAAHEEGQRDYYGAVSRVPGKWIGQQAPDEATLAKRLAFYAPSVAKMAHEATEAWHQTQYESTILPALSDLPQGNAQQQFSLADLPVKHTGVMVAFMLKPSVANILAFPGGEPASDLHITLAFLGDASDMDEAQQLRLVQAVQSYAATAQPLSGKVSGIGRFNPSASSDGKAPIIALLNIPGIQQWRAGFADVLEQAGTPVDATFEYTPHITLAYVDADTSLPVTKAPNISLRLNQVTAVIGDKHYNFPLGKPVAPIITLTDAPTGDVILLAGGIGEREDNLAKWQSSVGARITLQADLSWSGAQDGYVAAGFGDSANPYSTLWWDLEPTAAHCNDCPFFAANSPYDPPWTQGGNILNATPGDGNTECGAGCKCDLRYGGAVGATQTQDWKAWLPNGTPDVPDGPMQPVQPPAQKQAPSQRQQPTNAPPSPFEPLPRRESPYGPMIPGGEFNAGQKAALDLYRLAELSWNKVRGQLPELPNFFTLANPNFTWERLQWDELTKAQQQALQMALEAFFRWGANTSPEWLDYYDDFE